MEIKALEDFKKKHNILRVEEHLRTGKSVFDQETDTEIELELYEADYHWVVNGEVMNTVFIDENGEIQTENLEENLELAGVTNIPKDRISQIIDWFYKE